MLAVYLVTKAEAMSELRLITQPAYLMPRGRLSMPTPMRTFEELKKVCGRVDWTNNDLGCCTVFLMDALDQQWLSIFFFLLST